VVEIRTVSFALVGYRKGIAASGYNNCTSYPFCNLFYSFGLQQMEMKSVGIKSRGSWLTGIMVIKLVCM